MKGGYYLLIIGWLGTGGWPGTTSAQVLQRIDPQREAEVSRRAVDAQAADLPTLSQPVLNLPASATSRRRMQLKDRQQRDLTVELLELPQHPVTFVPVTNFTAKRAAASDRARSGPTVAAGRAPIRDRTLRPFAPGGEQDLKDQLNKRNF